MEDFNSRSEPALRAALGDCCAAQSWIAEVAAGRPYPSTNALHAASDRATARLDERGLAQALAGHPRIGERADSAWSRQEQAGMAGADAQLRTRMAAANSAYERRFGQVYLVCASGRSGAELLAVCEARLGNDDATERAVVLAELAKINWLRLAKLLHREGAQ